MSSIVAAPNTKEDEAELLITVTGGGPNLNQGNAIEILECSGKHSKATTASKNLNKNDT